MNIIAKARSFEDSNINWQNCELMEPPVTVSLSTDDLTTLLSLKGSITDIICYKFLCHTKSVDRCVKLVTEASSKVCSPEQREGNIISTLEYRGIKASFESKSHYKFHLT